MLKQNTDIADGPEARFTRLVARRLRDARNLLLASGGFLIALSIAGLISPLAAIMISVFLVGAAALPRRSRTMRLADKRRRDSSDISWHRAIELPLEAMDDPAYILRYDGTIKFQNDAAIAQFGHAEPDTHLSARIRSPAILTVTQQASEEGRAATVEHVERVPSERWFHVRCAPLEGTPGLDKRARLSVLTFRDMTEARRMDRMRTDFVANASHELRTPLASLTGFIETIKGAARNDRAAQARFLDIMEDQASRMTRLVDDLMSLSRLELKAHVPPTEPVDLKVMLQHVCDAMRPLAGDLGVTITLAMPDAPVRILGDRDELIQVFENLVENACKYGQSGKRVDVSLTLEPASDLSAPDTSGTAEVTVRDYGPGIAPEHVPRLTERFYRVDIETSRAQRGTGLGLAIVKHILTRHKSRLNVQSKLGEGSAFIVRFISLPESQMPDGMPGNQVDSEG